MTGIADRRDCGILHLGLGAFHRAHQADYTQDAMAAAGGHWGIVAVAMRNPKLATALSAQSCRYTLIEQHDFGPQLKDISAIRETLALSENPAAVIACMADPGIHVVTITVTEKGYGFDTASRSLDRANPVVAADLARPGTPTGLIGTLVAGLAARQRAGGRGMTVLSCDNLADNGALLRGLVLEAATEHGSSLAAWIADRCCFPASMVDRITPAATEATRMLAGGDACAVETEPFRQWVIEDQFAAPRPAWEAAGALIVADVRPFEAMKLRMLNGAHSLIAYLGTVSGLDAVRDVMEVPAFAALAARHMAAAAQTLPPLPGFDAEGYARALAARFANPAIRHRCHQIAMDGSQKLPQRLLIPAAEALARGLSARSYAFAVAAWLQHLTGRAETGTPHSVDDPLADLLRSLAALPPEAAVAALGRLPGFAVPGLWTHPGWCEEVAGTLRDLRDVGTRQAAMVLSYP